MVNRFILVAVLVAVALGAEFVGERTPLKDLKKTFEEHDPYKIAAMIEEAGGKVPKALEDLMALKDKIDAMGGGGDHGASGGKFAKNSSGKSKGKSAPKVTPSKSNISNMISAIPVVVTPKADEPKKTTPKPTPKPTPAAKTPEKPAKAPESKQELVDKYVSKQKGEAKAASIVVGPTDTVLSQCVKGECCDVSSGKFKKAGVTCYSSPCAAPSKCLGSSSHCPPSTEFLPDGTPCPSGTCQRGVCVAAAAVRQINNRRRPRHMNTAHRTPAPASAPVPPPPPAPAANITVNKISCLAGGCCDLASGFVKKAGSPCTESKHECYVSENVCNGLDAKCPRKAVPDGTPCSKGTCQNGQCVSPDKDKKAMSKKHSKRNFELDNNLNILRHKIRQAQKRQVFIHKAIKKNKLDEERRIARRALDFVNRRVKYEADLAQRAVYPYQTTTDMYDDPMNDENLHNYVSDVTNEQANYNNYVLTQTNANLQSAKPYEDFPWQLAVVFVAFVAIVCLIVGIVKVARSGSKKQKKERTEDYEYENF